MKRTSEIEEEIELLRCLPDEIVEVITRDLDFVNISMWRVTSPYWCAKVTFLLKTIRLLSSFLTRVFYSNFIQYPSVDSIILPVGFHESYFELAGVNNMVSRVRFLSLYKRSVSYDKIQPHFINLVSLHICHVWGDCTFKLLSTCSHLKILSFSGTIPSDILSLPRLNFLESFSFRCTSFFARAFSNILLQLDIALASLTNLKMLYLCGIQTDYSYLSELKELRFLQLIGTMISNDFIGNHNKCFMNLLGGLTNLKYLSLPDWIDTGYDLPLLPELEVFYTTCPYHLDILPNLKYHCFGIHHCINSYFMKPYKNEVHNTSLYFTILVSGNLPEHKKKYVFETYDKYSKLYLSIGARQVSQCPSPFSNFFHSYMKEIVPSLENVTQQDLLYYTGWWIHEYFDSSSAYCSIDKYR